jgi:dihydroorotate dehydrogenase (NAD+) catalytic subunit
MNNESLNLSVDLGKIKLRNPVMPASGTFGYGEEFADFLDINDLGAVIVKGTGLHPRLGSYEHRFVEVVGGSLCTIGLQGVGVEAFIKDKLPYLRQFNTPVIVNIMGESVEDFAKVTGILSKTEGIAGLEVNISCPNVAKGGMAFGVDVEATFNVIKTVRDNTDLTVIAKLTPNVSDISIFATACQDAGADAISLINGFVGMAIDINTRRSRLGKNLTGGITGPLLKPFALRLVWQVAQTVSIPVIGIGGITCSEDALEFLIAGATAVEIGTYNLIEPKATVLVIEGIKRYMIKNKIYNLKEITGSFKSG